MTMSILFSSDCRSRSVSSRLMTSVTSSTEIGMKATSMIP